ncbi:helix-turn-helix domain-containing protein [Schlesneria sp. T3-172]|uniref:helix-turn-helix domain-containing protein n=1 Tax=Schlesneria sphaerica TaxID=3373610 RepID=UPI0037CBE864
MAPNKKYLSLEEAAAQLGIKTEDLIRLREKGEVRGFADRGTWKFKADDVAEYRRRRQPDSDPDLQIIDEFGDADDSSQQATVIRKGSLTNSDSDVRLVTDDFGKNKGILSGSSSDMPTISLNDSDSDVRLVEPIGSAAEGSDSDVSLFIPRSGSKSDSDSDVRMIDLPDPGKRPHAGMNSDSDVRLATTDSDIRLSSFSDSDSDVKLIGPKGGKDSDSDVTLLSKKGDVPGRGNAGQGDSDFNLIGSARSDSVLHEGDDSSITLAGDSGIQLAGDSGIQLIGGGDSGIRLGASSGIRLGGADSGIRLDDDSGLQLQRPADSGISLEGADSGVRLADSGINLGDDSGIRMSPGSGKSFDLKSPGGKGKKADSSLKLKGSSAPASDELGDTSPMNLRELSDEDLGTTSPLLMPMDDDEADASDLEAFNASDTSELQALGDSDDNVVHFEDDDDAPPIAPKRKQKTVEESIFDDGESLEELEVSDHDLSGEEDIDDLAFDEDEDGYDDGFSAGSSQLGFGSSQKLALPQEVEWSAGYCTLLFASVCVLAFGTCLSADLLRTVWAGSGDSAVYPGFVGMLASLWK